jgi:ABC-type molybdate transport system ATPase subunit
MDESLANVDETTRSRIILTLKTLFPEKYFVYISHNMMEIARFCKQIIVLRTPDKQPQTCMIAGLDLLKDGDPAAEDLERTMLEIVHAA